MPDAPTLVRGPSASIAATHSRTAEVVIRRSSIAPKVETPATEAVTHSRRGSSA